jgi:hypothetical protein
LSGSAALLSLHAPRPSNGAVRRVARVMSLCRFDLPGQSTIQFKVDFDLR